MGTHENHLNDAILTCTHDLCFEQIKEKYHFFHLKIIIFTALKNYSILHRRFIVMVSQLANVIALQDIHVILSRAQIGRFGL